MNDIPHATDYFDFILYTDDTVLYCRMKITSTCLVIINDSLSYVYDWSDHQIVLDKLKYYGVNATPLKWFSSYLIGRQGLILGPLLFLIYMNDIPHASDYFDFILYADDTGLYCRMKMTSTYLTNINDSFSFVYDWSMVNKLSLDIKKTTFMVFHTLNKNVEGVITHLHIDNIPIERECSCNFLWLNLINENMLWKSHIDILL